MVPPIEEALDELERRYAFLGSEDFISALELKLMALKEQLAADAEPE